MSFFRAFHEWVGARGWSSPTIDRLAISTRPRRVPTVLDRVPPTLRFPRRQHAVSVVVPCYNYARFLPMAVSSALNQQGVDIEVIVVDDASTDDSLEVASRLRASDPRVVVLENAENCGHVRTFNNGLALATGEFVIRLDADDLLTPGAAARAVALFECQPTVGLVYGHPRHFTTIDPPAGRVGDVSWTVWRGTDWLEERCRQGVNCITTPEAMLRASVIADVGPLDTRLRYAQDMEMWMRAAVVADVARVNDVDQALHRDHPASMSVTDAAGALTDILERRDVFNCLFESMSQRVAGTERLRAMAMRSLALEALGKARYEIDRGRHDPALTRDLMTFANETSSGVEELAIWRSLQSRSGKRPLAVLAAARTIGARSRSELDYLHWTRIGL